MFSSLEMPHLAVCRGALLDNVQTYHRWLVAIQRLAARERLSAAARYDHLRLRHLL